MEVSLVMFKADGTRRDFPLSKSRVVVGRKNDCDLRIPLTSVSRQHCELEISDEQVKLRDLGSSNGTYHNSIRVQEAVLSAGDEIVVGPVVFTVVVDGEPQEIKPVRTIVGGASADSHVTAPAADMPKAAVVAHHEDDDEVMAEIEPEEMTPTVDLDDPIAALEAMADSDDDDASDFIDSGELQIIFDDDDEEASK